MRNTRNLVRRSKVSLRRYVRNRDGATAIEFALVFTPFLALVFGIIGVSLFYFTETILDQALNAATRQIRTGQNHATPSGELTVGKLKTQICDRSAGLIKCDKLTVVISNKAAWSDFTSLPSCTDANSTVVPSNYQDSESVATGAGGRERVVLVLACYPWELLASVPYIGLGNVNGGSSQLIQALAAFKSEPY